MIKPITSLILILPLLHNITTHSQSSLTITPNNDHPLFNHILPHEQIKNALKNEPIISIQPMDEYLKQHNRTADFTSDVFVITTTSGIKGVFKPSNDLCYAEVAAYNISNILNINLVPPTVIRTINNQRGSIQLLIEPANKMDASIINQSNLDIMRLFYFIIGQWDIGNDNQIIQYINNQPTLILIDNAAIINPSYIEYGDFAYVNIGTTKNSDSTNNNTPFPFHKPTILHKPKKEELIRYFSPFLPLERINTMYQRHSRFIFIIWDNRLWFQYYKNDPLAIPNYVSNITVDLISPFTRIDRSLLEQCWEEGLKSSHNTLISHLIDLTLTRKEILLNYYLKQPEKNCA